MKRTGAQLASKAIVEGVFNGACYLSTIRCDGSHNDARCHKAVAKVVICDDATFNNRRHGGYMVQLNDEYMMGLALAEAEAALEEGVFPVGAILSAGSKVLGRSHKTMVSNHLNHAEMNLFNQVFKGNYTFSRDDNLTLYTTLEPCIMCYGTMLHLPITRLVFAMTDTYGGCAHTTLGNPPPRHASRSVEVVGGVRRLEACKLFADFLDATTEEFWLTGGAAHFRATVQAEITAKI